MSETDRMTIVWRRLGKEAGESGPFQRVPADVVRDVMTRKVQAARSSDRSWSQLSDTLLVETSSSSDERLFYLPAEHLLLIKNPSSHPDQGWYVHLGSTDVDPDLGCWVFTDHFVDVLVSHDGSRYRVLDLDDLSEACALGLVDDTTSRLVLRRTQHLLDEVVEGRFPPPEVRDALAGAQIRAGDEGRLPCSPRETAGGMVWFPRMLDKIRLNQSGALPEVYRPFLGRGFDGRCLDYLRVPYDALVARTLEGGADEELLAWCFETGRRLTDRDIEVWNGFLSKRGWRDGSAVEADFVAGLEAAGLAGRDDIQTYFDYNDADEGRG